MITQLYVFSPGSYVVAEEWNANFSTLYSVSLQHEESISDMRTELAFPDSDLSMVFNAVRAQRNSHYIDGNSVEIHPEQEYYQTLYENLSITIPTGTNGGARILVYLPQDWNQLFFSVNYSGTTIINHYDNNVFRSGYYYIIIFESNGLAQIKLIWTGV